MVLTPAIGILYYDCAKEKENRLFFKFRVKETEYITSHAPSDSEKQARAGIFPIYITESFLRHTGGKPSEAQGRTIKPPSPAPP